MSDIKEKVAKKINNLSILIPDVTSNIPKHRKMAIAGIAVSLGRLCLRLPSVFEDECHSSEGKLLSLNSKNCLVALTKSFHKWISTSHRTESLSKSSSFKFKYLYWRMRSKSCFTQNQPSRASLSKILRLLDNGNLSNLPDPLVMDIWLQNDAKNITKETTKKRDKRVSIPLIDGILAGRLRQLGNNIELEEKDIDTIGGYSSKKQSKSVQKKVRVFNFNKFYDQHFTISQKSVKFGLGETLERKAKSTFKIKKKRN